VAGAMPGGGLALLLWAALLLVASACAYAQPQAAGQVRRVALIVGNGAYQHTQPLTNPGNDARDMAESLRALGYEVIEGLDLDKAALDRIIHRFARALHDADDWHLLRTFAASPWPTCMLRVPSARERLRATSGADKFYSVTFDPKVPLRYALAGDEGHGRYVLSAAFARDASTIASGGGDGAVLLWETQTGKLVRRLAGHAADVEGVAFLADGKRVASVSEDKTLRIWDTATGAQLAVAVGFADGEYVAYTPDGRFTGSPGAQQHLRILEDGSERALEGADARLNSAAGLALAPR
jgi:hypothetical protein